MNKKNVSKFVALNMISLMILTPEAGAGISGKRSNVGQSSSTSDGGSTTIKPGKAIPESSIQHSGVASASCKQDPDVSEYLPLDFFKEVTRDGLLPTFEQRGDNKVIVKMPAVLDGCGKFAPQIIQSKDNPTDVVVAMTIENDPIPPATDKVKGNTYAGLLRCLSEKGFLKDGVINHDDIPGKEYSEYSYVIDYDFNKVILIINCKTSISKTS